MRIRNYVFGLVSAAVLSVSVASMPAEAAVIGTNGQNVIGTVASRELSLRDDGKKTGWRVIGGKQYYILSNGKKKTGWLTWKGNKYYFLSDGTMKTGWKTIGGKRYYFQSDGRMRTAGWFSLGGKRYYFLSDGSMKTGWKTIGGKRYYFLSDGTMKTGWKTINGKRYYFNNSGVMLTGWISFGSTRYYMNKYGQMQTGWISLKNRKYYLNSDGTMHRGWLKFGSSKYYLNSNGVMQTGWQTIGGKKYHFKSNGVMQTGKVQIGGKWYEFAANGQLIGAVNTAAQGKAALQKYLQQALQAGGEYYSGDWKPVYSYFWYDMDSDGLDELFIRYGIGELDTYINVYEYRQGQVEILDQIDGGHTIYYSIPGKGMLGWWGHQGVASMIIATKQNGEIHSEMIFDEDVYASGAEYTQPAEIVPGAKYIAETYVN